ncbi:MAG: UpxY family transcription antiterminator [Bacteroidales bacterium]
METRIGLSKPKWFVLYTAPRSEKKVYERLVQTGIEAYLPLHLCPRVWSDRIKMVEVPLIPSYIFVYTKEVLLRNLLAIYGVSRIVFYDGKPAVIHQKEIDSIKKFLEKSREKEVSFSPNEEVLIAVGALKDVSGKIQKVGKDYLLLHIEQLGITATVKVKTEQVKKKK